MKFYHKNHLYLFLFISLRSIREEKAQLMKKESELCAPKLTNLKYIPMMYKWFYKLADEHEEFKGIPKINLEREFLIVTLFFYSPTTLAGGNMTKGLRAELAHLFDTKTPTTVSNHCADALVWYDSYKFFRREADLFYEEILDLLKAEGILAF